MVFAPNILCDSLQLVYITTVYCGLCNIFMNLHYGNRFWGFSSLGIDFFPGICYHFHHKSCDEDTRLRKDSQREGHWVRGLRTPAVSDTTSEPPGGNARMGAPIIAPMSDGCSRNQGGTVEYFVSHP